MVDEIWYKRRGFGDFSVFRKECWEEYQKIKTIPRSFWEKSLLRSWEQIERDLPEYNNQLIDYENKYICRIDVKTSLGKFPRLSNILTFSQKNMPNYDYVLRVKLYEDINASFTGELNSTDLNKILNNSKLNINANYVDNIVKVGINDFRGILYDIGVYILRDYFRSKNYDSKIWSRWPYDNGKTVVVYQSEDSALKINSKITLNNFVVVDYQESELFDTRVHIKIDNNFRNGFKGIINDDRINAILKE